MTSFRILVTHPGRQHSHQLAQALYENDHLRGYWTGVPAADPETKGEIYRLIAHWSPQPTTRIPASHVRHNYIAPVVRRIAHRMPDPSARIDFTHRAEGWFDAWAAQQLPKGLNAVVCYESGALRTFESAKSRGVTTILDAASFHYAWQDQFYNPVESEDVHARINQRKDREIALTDHMLTVSELARQSYIEAGVPPERVTSVPMGASLDAFQPVIERPTEAPFTFIFAGHAGERKGIDVLLDASEQLHRQAVPHRIQVAGGCDADVKGRLEQAPTVEQMGYLGRDALASAFQRADCLVLPSRHDSFGRVVVEAMATGTPVLLSENVGAKEVVAENENGWVVRAEDAEALARQMRWCIEHRDHVGAMREQAAATAQQYSWDAYRTRVVRVIEQILN